VPTHADSFNRNSIADTRVRPRDFIAVVRHQIDRVTMPSTASIGSSRAAPFPCRVVIERRRLARKHRCPYVTTPPDGRPPQPSRNLPEVEPVRRVVEAGVLRFHQFMDSKKLHMP